MKYLLNNPKFVILERSEGPASCLHRRYCSHSKQQVLPVGQDDKFKEGTCLITPNLSSLSAAKDLLLACTGDIARTSKQQVLPVGQDDKFKEGTCLMIQNLSSLSAAKDLLLACTGDIARTSKQQVLPVGQDDKFKRVPA